MSIGPILEQTVSALEAVIEGNSFLASGYSLWQRCSGPHSEPSRGTRKPAAWDSCFAVTVGLAKGWRDQTNSKFFGDLLACHEERGEVFLEHKDCPAWLKDSPEYAEARSESGGTIRWRGISVSLFGSVRYRGLVWVGGEVGPTQSCIADDKMIGDLITTFSDLTSVAGAQFVEADAKSRLGLSPRTLECLRWVAEGKSSQEVASILGISTAGVEYHMRNAIEGLNAANRAHAVSKAISLGLI